MSETLPGEVDDAGGARRLDALWLDFRGIARLLAVTAVILAVVGAVVNVVIYQVIGDPEADVARVLARFDLGHEPSVPAWFSSGLLLINATMLLLLGRAARGARAPFALHWTALGLVFVALSADEAALFHEMVDTFLSRKLETDGVLTFPWVIAGSAFAALVALLYLPFLLHLPRRFALLFVLSGALFVGGAVGMELFSAIAIDRHGIASLAHAATQTIEESMEMAGSILFFLSLSRYWTHTYGDVRLGIRA